MDLSYPHALLPPADRRIPRRQPPTPHMAATWRASVPQHPPTRARLGRRGRSASWSRARSAGSPSSSSVAASRPRGFGPTRSRAGRRSGSASWSRSAPARYGWDARELDHEVVGRRLRRRLGARRSGRTAPRARGHRTKPPRAPHPQSSTRVPAPIRARSSTWPYTDVPQPFVTFPGLCPVGCPGAEQRSPSWGATADLGVLRHDRQPLALPASEGCRVSASRPAQR